MTASELYAALAAKGVTLAVHGNRLRASPWSAMSDDERAGFRLHRQELKRFVILGPSPRATRPDAAPSAPKPEALCSYCGNRVCLGKTHTWYPVLHFRDPAEIFRRNAEATKVMLSNHGHHPVEFYEPARPRFPGDE
jgi:hypothetical protein